MPERKYLPTFAELTDRLAIVRLKSVFIPEHKAEYDEEIALILHDMDVIIEEKSVRLKANDIHAILMIMLSNRYIWENESSARAGGADQDKLLKRTHSINGVRNTAKNVLAVSMGERKDYKIDSLASELAAEFGSWDVFK
jgi:hypothetical protein